MRQERTVQASIFDLFAEHEIGCELKAMSEWLDEHGDLLGLVARDPRRHGLRQTGREGLPAEAVLRGGLLKQHRQLSYQELAFHLEDSASFRELPGFHGAGTRRSRFCTRRSARSGRKPLKRSTACCWRAPGRRSWKVARSCAWTAPLPPH